MVLTFSISNKFKSFDPISKPFYVHNIILPILLQHYAHSFCRLRLEDILNFKTQRAYSLTSSNHYDFFSHSTKKYSSS